MSNHGLPSWWLWSAAVTLLAGALFIAAMLGRDPSSALELSPSMTPVEATMERDSPLPNFLPETPPSWLDRPSSRTRAKKTPSPAVDAAPADPESSADQEEEEAPKKIVVLPGKVSGDDHLITVKTRAKMKPLFDAEEYKRRGMRGILGGYQPVKPAPRGIEAEAD